MRITCARCAASSRATDVIVSTHPGTQSPGQRVSSSSALVAAFFSRKAWSISRRIGSDSTPRAHSIVVRECSGNASTFASSLGPIMFKVAHPRIGSNIRGLRISLQAARR